MPRNSGEPEGPDLIDTVLARVRADRPDEHRNQKPLPLLVAEVSGKMGKTLRLGADSPAAPCKAAGASGVFTSALIDHRRAPSSCHVVS